MSTRLGVDLGTTWTAAAVATAGGVEPLNLGTHGAAIPSVIAVEGDRVVVGESAERHLLVSPADGAREFKRRLGDETPYLLGGSPYGAEALMGKLLAQVVATATERGGTAPDEVVLTHPATWGGTTYPWASWRKGRMTGPAKRSFVFIRTRTGTLFRSRRSRVFPTASLPAGRCSPGPLKQP